MAKKKHGKSIELLNKAVADELLAIHQYMNQHYGLDDSDFGELAAQVKEDGKTQVLPALNPSERRVIHMILQEDKEIRSRSVGDGLFKKILIYKPGKNNRGGGRKRPQAKGRK